MKNNLFTLSILVFSSLIYLFGCNQRNKSNIEKNENGIVKDDFKLNTAEDTSKFETKYNDGRITAVRNIKYYNYLVRDSKPFGDSKLELSTVISEWNGYDANIASAQGGFIQVQRSKEEIVKLREELKASDGDTTLDINSTMVGGDEETNKRFKEPCIRYWAVASKMFEQEFKTLKKATNISNRDTNYVTFDFITSNGIYTVQEKKSILESNQSVWSNLFKESKFLNIEMARVQNESQMDFEKSYNDKQLKKNKK